MDREEVPKQPGHLCGSQLGSPEEPPEEQDLTRSGEGTEEGHCMCEVPAAAGADPEPERRPRLQKARDRAAGAEGGATFGNLHLTRSETRSPGRV